MNAFVGPELAPYLYGDKSARRDPLVAQLAKSSARSYHSAEPGEYTALVARLLRAAMAGLVDWLGSRQENLLAKA